MQPQRGKEESGERFTYEDLRRAPTDPEILDPPFRPTIDEAVINAAVDKVLSAHYPKPKANRAAR